MPKLCIFDLDCTLIDSISAITSCKQDIAREHFPSWPEPTREQVQTVLGKKLSVALMECFARDKKGTPISTHQLEEFESLFIERSKLPEYQASLFPGTRGMLELLKQRGLKLAIATSKPQALLYMVLEYVELSNFFDITLGADPSRPGKPNPTILRDIMRHCNVDPTETIMIGDSVSDMQCAHNASVESIGVSWGVASTQMLREAGATTVIENWDELRHLVEAKISCRL